MESRTNARAAPSRTVPPQYRSPSKDHEARSCATVPDDASSTVGIVAELLTSRADAFPDIVALLLDPAAEVELRRQLCREVARDAWRDGHRAGYERAMRDMARAWAEVAVPASKGGPTYQELEARRWTVRGEQRSRETYGEPHAEDYAPHIRQEKAHEPAYTR